MLAEFATDVASELLEPTFLILYAYVACVLYVHLRSRVRQPFLRQLIHHSGICSPYNVLMYAFSAVSSKPLLDARQFKQLDRLRDNWTVFRDEAKALHASGYLRAPATDNDLVFINLYRRGWKRFHLRFYADDFLPSAKELCPRSVEILRSVPDIHCASFTLLPAGGTIGKHRDPLAGSLRYHLGLVTPNSEKCTIWVDGEPHTWRDGEDVVFDETYIHWARNETDQDRIILFCDVERPLRSRVLQVFSNFMNRRVFTIMGSSNDAQEAVGLMNRLTPVVGQLRSIFQRAKRWNRPAYKLGQQLLIAIVVYFTFVHGLVMRLAD
jgi:beta-hydroxylase